MARQSGRRAAAALAVAVLFGASCPGSEAADFAPSCANPSLPGSTVAVDNRCGIEGAGGEEAEQDRLKNNFCAAGPAATITFEELKALQAKVEQDGHINFGDRANPGSHGPTTNRAPLQALGEGRLVQLSAFVLTAKQEGGESVNCGHDFDSEPNKALFHDIHIALVENEALSRPAANEEALNECQGVVVEMVPHYRPPEWNAAHLKKVAAAHLPVRVTGHLFFDSSHVPCSGGKPVRMNPKRMSLWEIHPVYKFEVCTSNCGAEGTWLPLEQWQGR